MIEVTNLSIKRGRKWIIENLNFQAKNDEFTVIAGPNGSGKTTFFSALCQDLPYQGNIFYNGKNIKDYKPREKAFMRGVLPQSSALSFPYLVREVLSFGLLSGNAINEVLNGQDIALLALQKVGLESYSGRFYQELSGGEQSRVQLARVLCQVWHAQYQNQPCWLLLDEPVASLDIEHQLVVMNIAKAFTKAGGGVIAILHDLNLAASFADKLILMKNGKIMYQGEPSSVMTTQSLHEIYNCKIVINKIPAGNVPFVLPQTMQET